MKRRYITLLVIGSASEEGLSPIQIQKSLFIIGQSHLRGLPPNFYSFYPYNYGPFCEQVYQDADSLVEDGLVFKVPVSGQSWFRYIITAEGRKKVKEIKGKINHELDNYIKKTVEWVSSLAFNELLRAIYAKYPQYSLNSVFQG